LDEAVQVASCIGAQVVSLTGLLPSATDYGAALVRYLGDRIEPRISNGHGTTIAAVGLSIEAALAAAGRPMCRERVGVLGLGSIGRGTLELVLRCMSAPAALILCDVHRQRESLDAIAGRVRMLGFQGPVHVVTSAGPVPDDFYGATLIVGATNAATVLDVNRVRPGTVIVDDSAPHCFDPAVARRRMESAADLVVAEGGMIRTLDTIRQRQYVPRAVARLVADTPAAPWRLCDARQITGCEYAS